MCTLVALDAGLEFTQHFFAVRLSMAILAFRYIAMLVGMAVDTLKTGMLGRA